MGRRTEMALYRCPNCGDVVRKNARRCRTCGLWFDLDHEPVPTEDDVDSIKLSKKEKRILAVIAVAVVIVVVIAILVALGNAKMLFEAVQRWQRRPRRRVAADQWPQWGKSS